MKKDKLVNIGFGVIFFIIFANSIISSQGLTISSGAVLSFGSATLSLQGELG